WFFFWELSMRFSERALCFIVVFFFFLMRRTPKLPQGSSSAPSDGYKGKIGCIFVSPQAKKADKA
ncbi:hypothetical protein KJR58_24360, partial [Escherichia coli]|uniref:hypothetical protein n=1 Tax=Escherichia coli TaxID=562 RepID=UPI00200627D3